MTVLSVVPFVPIRECFDHPQFFRVPGHPALMFYCYVPSSLNTARTPLVLVHGISRNSIELVCQFKSAAREHGVPLIAPHFTAASYGMYQQLHDQRRQVQADQALLRMLEIVSKTFDFDSSRFDLFGFSGGAQFAHRLAYLFPDRVRSCVPVSAGWYTMPEAATAWPYGLNSPPSGTIDAESVRKVPFHVIVGRRDTLSDASLRRSRTLDRQQGKNRVTRARNWFEAMQSWQANPANSLTILPKTNHSFGSACQHGLVPLTFKLLGYPAEGSGENS